MKRSGFRRPSPPPRPTYVFPAKTPSLEWSDEWDAMVGRVPSPAELRAVPKEPKPVRDAAHLRAVRRLPCCACGYEGRTVPHHRHGETGNLKGMAQKAGDDTVVPLCSSGDWEDGVTRVGCHEKWHGTGRVRHPTTGDLTREETIALFEKTRAELWAARLEQRRGR